MTQETHYHCDRCGSTVLENLSVFKAEAGPMLPRFKDRRVDLCQDCCEQFLNWLKGGPAAGRSLREPTAEPDEIPLGPVGRVARRLDGPKGARKG